MMTRMLKPIHVLLLLSVLAAPVMADSQTQAQAQAQAQADSVGYGRGVMQPSGLGENVEFQLDSYTNKDERFTPWWQDDGTYLENLQSTVEVQQVTKQNVTTKKLTDVVPPIRFQSGEADIPQEVVTKLRKILADMRDRVNVRVHFVGHSDNAKLIGDAKQKYGDNLGLSKERAGTAAEFFQQALDLPPEAISYEGVGDSKPIATNDTEAGRAQNRRVEVQVWYDEVSEELVDKEVKVEQQIKRIKVCRVETVCMVRYKDGHSRRAKLKNLLPPLHYDDNVSEIPQKYLHQLRQALENLKDKDHVQLHFIGYTDDTPLSGRDARIYGDHVGLSKANARRAALAVQDALQLPAEAIASGGKGANHPLASNNSEKGRALNRRIEIEFWHDDPLEDLPEAAQICPESSAAETVEQLKSWGARNDVPVVAQGTGADAAAVIYDAMQSAKARGVDVLIADTAGRLHTQSNLMEELKKIRRVIGRVDESAPHEVMLVVDAGTGTNALNQARHFNEAVGLTGIAITKLDGTARGGMLFAIASELGTPIRFIGVGEAAKDLRPFDAGTFINAILPLD